MALRLKNNHCKSTSDILDQSSEGERFSLNHSFNRYRTYTVKDLNNYKQCLTEETILKFEETRVSSPSKTQSFVKKLISALENKNEVCKADDEFLTTYYGKDDQLNRNHLQIIEKDRYEKSWDKEVGRNLKTEESSTTFHDFSGIVRKDAKIRHSCNALKLSPLRDIERNRSEVKFDEISIELNKIQNQTRSLKLDRNRKEKVTRRRSFKDFLSSIVKWKKSEVKEIPHSVSCDNLAEETRQEQKNIKKLSRTASLQVATFEEFKRDNFQRKSNSATIHPPYVGKRNDNPSIILREKQITAVNNNRTSNYESLVKPSAIKDLAKRFSQRAKELETINISGREEQDYTL